MSLSLSGLRVLDLSRILTGPYCTMLLGDLGAEVIKVEPPGGDDTRQWGPPFVGSESSYYLSVNRNKKSMVLNLRHPQGKEVLARLVRRSDVLVENFRPGALARLGFPYEKMRELNRGLIYCAISGFGQTGPYRDKPGYDVLAQAMGGLMSVTGYPDAPPVKAGMSVADIGAGMFAVIGILAALRHRDQTGEGQMVDTSLLETMIAWHTYFFTAYFASGKVPAPLGSAHPSIVPYQAVRARDGYLIVAVGNDALWQKFCAAVGLQALAGDPRFATNQDRVMHRDECIRLIEAHLATDTAQHWTDVLEAAGVPAGPILNLAQVYSDPHVLAREMVLRVEHPTAGPLQLPGIPVKLSATPGAVQSPPPTLGQHTAEILQSLGYSAAEVAALQGESVV